MDRKSKARKLYCIDCRKITSYQYNLALGHSECLECGNTFKKRPKFLSSNKTRTTKNYQIGSK